MIYKLIPYLKAIYYFLFIKPEFVRVQQLKFRLLAYVEFNNTWIAFDGPIKLCKLNGKDKNIIGKHYYNFQYGWFPCLIFIENHYCCKD